MVMTRSFAWDLLNRDQLEIKGLQASHKLRQGLLGIDIDLELVGARQYDLLATGSRYLLGFRVEFIDLDTQSILLGRIGAIGLSKELCKRLGNIQGMGCLK